MSPISSRKTVPPSAISNFPFLRYCAPGERAFFVAEELAFEQRFGERAAMNDDQRMEPARAGVVDGARDQFFAGAAFAGDQHRGVGGRDGLDGVKDLLHGFALADDVLGTGDFGDGFAQAHVFFFGAFVSERLLHQMRDLVGIERLGDVVVGAVLERGDGGFDRGVAGHHDDDEIGIDLMHAALQFDAVGAAHLDVEQGEHPISFRPSWSARRWRSRRCRLRSLLRETIWPASHAR